MKKIFTNFLLIGFAALITISCHNDPNEQIATSLGSQINVVNGRLSFQNSSAFFSTLLSLDKMKRDQLNDWASHYHFKSLKNKIDTLTPDSVSLKNFPRSHQMVLNENGEVQIGDTIVWYTGTGLKHYVLHSDENELARIKAGGKNNLTGSFRISGYSLPESKIKKHTNAFFLNTGLDARWQMQFNSYRGTRKFVNQIQQLWDQSYSVLYLNIKMEYWGGCGWFCHEWKPAGDYRYIQYDLAYTCYLLWGSADYGGNPVTFTGYISDSLLQNSDDNIPLASDGVVAYAPDHVWYIDISGSIYQYMQNDDPNNEWNCVGYPLW